MSINSVQVQIFQEPRSPEEVVKSLSLIEGPVDVYFWYEGTQGLPTSGARFMTDAIFAPLYELKQDAKLCLYSLKGWDFANAPTASRLQEPISRIDQCAVECFSASSFFAYCKEIADKPDLYVWMSHLPQKQWLFDISSQKKEKGLTIQDLFQNSPSLFDTIQHLDVFAGYSFMQYVEGYYLIRESIKRGLLLEKQRIEIAFALPNDESKYYLDLPIDLPQMLFADFKNELEGIQINVNFLCFSYGESLTARPYVDKDRKASKVAPIEISSYFNYLSQKV